MSDTDDESGAGPGVAAAGAGRLLASDLSSSSGSSIPSPSPLSRGRGRAPVPPTPGPAPAAVPAKLEDGRSSPTSLAATSVATSSTLASSQLPARFGAASSDAFSSSGAFSSSSDASSDPDWVPPSGLLIPAPRSAAGAPDRTPRRREFAVGEERRRIRDEMDRVHRGLEAVGGVLDGDVPRRYAEAALAFGGAPGATPERVARAAQLMEGLYEDVVSPSLPRRSLRGLRTPAATQSHGGSATSSSSSITSSSLSSSGGGCSGSGSRKRRSEQCSSRQRSSRSGGRSSRTSSIFDLLHFDSGLFAATASSLSHQSASSSSSSSSSSSACGKQCVGSRSSSSCSHKSSLSDLGHHFSSLSITTTPSHESEPEAEAAVAKAAVTPLRLEDVKDGGAIRSSGCGTSAARTAVLDEVAEEKSNGGVDGDEDLSVSVATWYHGGVRSGEDIPVYPSHCPSPASDLTWSPTSTAPAEDDNAYITGLPQDDIVVGEETSTVASSPAAGITVPPGCAPKTAADAKTLVEPAAMDRAPHPPNAKSDKDALVPLLLELLTEQEEDFEDDNAISLSDWAASCLVSISLVVHNDICRVVLPFVKANIYSESWRLRGAAITAFGCILEGTTSEFIVPYVVQAIPVLARALNDDNNVVKNSAIYCVSNVCQHHLFALPPDQLHLIIQGLIKKLQESQMRLACHAASAIFNIAQSCRQVVFESTNALSAPMLPLLKALLAAADRPGAQGANLPMPWIDRLVQEVDVVSDPTVPMVAPKSAFDVNDSPEHQSEQTAVVPSSPGGYGQGNDDVNGHLNEIIAAVEAVAFTLVLSPAYDANSLQESPLGPANEAAGEAISGGLDDDTPRGPRSPDLSQGIIGFFKQFLPKKNNEQRNPMNEK